MERAGRRVVATNGCFDVLHAGHAVYLEGARRLGDVLLVGVNEDAAVRALKGPGRPVNGAADRALLLAALADVDAVCVFPGLTAEEFLRRARPAVYAKGGDYTPATMCPADRVAAEALGAEVVVVPGLAGRSTSALLARADAGRGG